MNTNRILTIIVLAAALFFFFVCNLAGVGNVKAAGVTVQVRTEGIYTCLADNRTDPSQDASFPPEGYHCQLVRGPGATLNQSEGSSGADEQGASQVIVTAAPPTIEHTSVSTTQALPTNVPTQQATASPAPTVEKTADPEPWTPECKNPNSGRDGTPNECNAGIGQEKQQP